MKRFLLTVLVWSLGLLIVFLSIEAFFNRHKGRLDYLIGKEVVTAIDKSKVKTGKTKLILGDSVCNQMYPSDKEYPDLVSLACNRIITLAGQYFLLKNYVAANSCCPPKTVVILLHPVSIQIGLDRFAYQYMLKNFLTKEYKAEFNGVLWSEIQKIPYYWTASLPFIRVSNYSPQYTLDVVEDQSLISPISSSYFEKIVRLSEEYHFDLFLYCPPVDYQRKEATINLFKRSVEENVLPMRFLEEYIESAQFVRDSIFDGLHFSKGCVPSDYLNLL